MGQASEDLRRTLDQIHELEPRRSILLVPEENWENFRSMFGQFRVKETPSLTPTVEGIPVVSPKDYVVWIMHNFKDYNMIYVVHKDRIVILDRQKIEDFKNNPLTIWNT